MRLTMGGEPTFVSIDDFESDEWNTAAVGPTKRPAGRHADPAAAGPLRAGRVPALRAGQMVPRRVFAALDLLALLAPRRQADLARCRFDRRGTVRRSSIDENPGAKTDAGKAEVLLEDRRRNARCRTGLCSAPAYEDPAAWIVKEGNLPDNVTPENSRLDDPEERHRIATVFARGLTKPSGYRFADPALAGRGQAGAALAAPRKWKTRRGNLYLVPGDSPVGYRLPLGALPYVPPTHYPYVTNADPTVRQGAACPTFSARTAPAETGRCERARTAARSGRCAVSPLPNRCRNASSKMLGELDGAVRTATVGRGEGRAVVRVHAAGRTSRGLSSNW